MRKIAIKRLKRHFIAVFILLTTAVAAPPVSSAFAMRRAQSHVPALETLLEFTSGGHSLGFRAGEFYLTNPTYALRVQFVGAHPVAPQSDGTVTSPERGAPPLQRVTYANLWDGITLAYEPVSGGLVRSAYRLEPCADIRAIRLRYNVPVTRTVDGALTLTFPMGQMTESAPVAWQEIEGRRLPVPIDFQVLDSAVQLRDVGFHVGAYDPTRPLFIDPTLTWNTFLGGSSIDYATGMAIDASGNIYVTGYSFSTWQGPTPPRRLFSGGATDAFVAKLDASGNLVWNTFLGCGDDYGNGIAVDGAGNVYVVGYSSSTWQGATAPRRSHTGNSDAFVAKLDATGDLIWNTFLGAGSDDYGNGIAVDGSGNLYVTGESNSNWQDAEAPRRAYSGGADAFVARLNTSGDLTWNTFLGGSAGDYGHGIAVYEGGGAVYVSGYSDATWQGAGAPRRDYIGNYDAFVARLDMSGDLAWNTFLGGAANDTVDGDIVVDGSGNVYVTGSSRATWQETTAPRHAYTGLADAFVAKVAADGSVAWNTFLGGSVNDFGHAIAVDGSGDVYVTGASYSTWQGTTPPELAYSNDYDAFAAQLDPNGDLAWNAFLGGAGEDVGFGVGVDASDNVFVTGHSNISWQGTTAPRRTHSGNFDAFVAKLAPNSSNANLSNLVLSSGTLIPAFAPGTTSYAADVTNTVTSVQVTPTAADGSATITVNGGSVASGSAATIALSVGANTISIIVTAQNGETTRTYTVTVTRASACASAITVANANDSGAGTLRQAIADICADGTITFAGDYTIRLASALTIDKNMTIDGTGRAVAVSGDSDNDGDGDVRVFHVQSSVAATLTHLSIVSGNVAGGYTCPVNCGGGIYNQGTLTVQTSTLSGNSALFGGGIYNQGTLTVQSSTLANNYADFGGGGIANDSGEVTVSTSTLSGNSTGYTGGGIYNLHGKLMVQTCTLSGNRAGAGGGINNESGTAFKVYNSTLSGNSAGNGGGGILNYGTWLDLMHTIIANSPEGGDCVLISGGGGWATSGYGLIESTGANACGCNSDYSTIVGVDPLLGPLADNGGATQTFALLPGSPAIDAGSSSGCPPDQRGIVRPVGGACDIGAFESRGFTLTKSGGDNQHTVINTAFVSPLRVTLTETGGPALPGAVITFTQPGSGASAVLSSGTATTDGSGSASVSATANGAAGGPYDVSASAAGGTPNVAFALTNDKLGATVTLGSLTQEYDGTPKSVTVTTNPVGLTVTSTYTGTGSTVYGPSTTAPTNVGTYSVVATVADPNYQGSATDTLVIQDTTAPALLSFTRQTPGTSPTNADTLVFRATFSEGVQNLLDGTADFTVNGTTTATVTGVAALSASTYDVTVSGGDLAGFNGTVGLNLAAGHNITDLAGNVQPTGEPGTDQTYLLDNTSVGVTSILRQTPVANPTNLTSLTFRLTFTGDVQNVDTTDFSLATTGTATGTIASVVVQSASVYDVVITGVGGNGVLDLNLAAAPPRDIADPADNPLGASPVIGTEETYTIDTASPTVTIGQAAGQADPTTVTPVNFAVVFSEPVADFASGDVTVSGTAGATTVTVTEAAPMDGTTYNIAVNGMTTAGTVVITIAGNIAHDAASNGNAASTNLDNSVRFTFTTTTALTVSPNPSAAGQTVIFTATVTSASGAPTGTVTFREGATVLGTGVLNGSGQATFTTGGLAPGTHTITAEYGGDVSFVASASAGVDQVVQPSSAGAQIPTLGEWGVILLMALVAGVAAYRLRTRSES